MPLVASIESCGPGPLSGECDLHDYLCFNTNVCLTDLCRIIDLLTVYTIQYGITIMVHVWFGKWILTCS